MDKTLTSLEQECLSEFRSGLDPTPSTCRNPEDWLRFGLTTLLKAGRMVRTELSGGVDADLKEDGSPATRLEAQIEADIRERLKTICPEVRMVGEETGGILNPDGLSLAVDPVDGTWAFLTGASTAATTLAVFDEAQPVIGMVSNPSTGEIAYAAKDQRSRLLRLSLYGETDTSVELPDQGGNSAPVLVNFHPARAGAPLLKGLYESWQRGEIHLVRGPGGSPSWALAEAARGAFTYVNLWSEQPAEPYDLAAGALLVIGAGGQVCDLENQPADLIRHRGPFVAGINAASRRLVTGLLKGVLSD